MAAIKMRTEGFLQQRNGVIAMLVAQHAADTMALGSCERLRQAGDALLEKQRNNANGWQQAYNAEHNTKVRQGWMYKVYIILALLTGYTLAK